MIEIIELAARELSNEEGQQFSQLSFDVESQTVVICAHVRRHINWDNQQPDLGEALVHLFHDIRRRTCGIASAGSPWFSV